MILIPGKATIPATIREGSVFYFKENSHANSEEPHYFVVLNINPLTDEVIILTHSSSQVDKVRKRTSRFPGTLVEVTRAEYSCFTKDTSAFNCNDIIVKSIGELINLYDASKLVVKQEMPSHILSKLRSGVAASPVVEGKHKKLVCTDPS